MKAGRERLERTPTTTRSTISSTRLKPAWPQVRLLYLPMEITAENSGKKWASQAALLADEAGEIPGQEAMSPEQAHNGSQGQKRAEGHGILPPLPACREEADGNGASGKDSQQDGQ